LTKTAVFFMILTSGHFNAQGSASECPDVKNHEGDRSLRQDRMPQALKMIDQNLCLSSLNDPFMVPITLLSPNVHK